AHCLDQHSNGAAGEDEPRPRKQREGGEVPRRPQVPLKPDRERIDQTGVPNDRRQHRDCRRDHAVPQHARPGGAREAPHETGGDNRRPHDVQDVDAEDRHQVAAGRDDEPLHPEEKGEDEDLQPPPADHPDGARPAGAAPRSACRGEHDGKSGQPEKQRRRESSEDRGIAKGSRSPHVEARPRVGRVRLDHQQHGDAARPVDVGASPGPSVVARGPGTHAEAGACSRVTVNAMSFRIECQTEQYFSRDSAIARSTVSAGTSPSTVMCSVTRTNRWGSSCDRSAMRCARSPRSGWRPFARMWATSVAMQPASAKPRACTGEGPATPAPSSIIDAVPLAPENLRSPTHVRSTTVGGFRTPGIVTVPGAPGYRAAECPAGASTIGGLDISGPPAGRWKTGRPEKTALISNQPSGRITRKYVRT